MKTNWSEALKVLMLAMMVVGGTALLTGCEDGGFEEAGEEIDDAVDEAEDEL